MYYIQNWDQIFDGLDKSKITADEFKAAEVEVSTNLDDIYGPIIASNDTLETVKKDQKNYLTFNLPLFKTIRSLTFILRSRGSRWSRTFDDWGTFKGTWSWLDVELWRPTRGPKPTGRDVHLAGNGWELDPKKMIIKNKKYMVGTWLLQRNRHAMKVWEDYTVTWDVNEFELDDKVAAKWEEGFSEKGNEDPKVAKKEKWHKGGWSPNGQFVRNLKPGDELRIMMKASTREPGWKCEVMKCDVRAIWT
ncbi:hypothetical protein TWF569_002732 [Orbilia oligospora]|uniref:Uncharacterized protein n=1 Tax=Orbilia oligospora TaxID=2813651 RepID=A0A7C8K5M2_ORBOL|nr:hypothetical protein TWF706_008841 [Orbilia oligospora]KAF3096402.1 hypothetical protein TWF102_006673 [Orbilia oligospora]KAF3118319.1 hypothetical protein TWF103_000333 [Orbilia oligospora]KAF3140573.1 hypothetical protein TWF703_002778 [Orbilia oligospora]KAF3149285.1 hypothetical protein TWF594_011330 [Orbilia oligospora]